MIPDAPSRSTPAVENQRLRGLDSLRGIAISLVVIFHVQLHFSAPGLIGKIALLGYNGVQLFFIVSGVTMCYMWALRKNESWEARKFLIRRLCRIAPPFWFAMAFYMLWRTLGVSNLAPADARDVLLTALLLHGFSAHAINLVVPGGWSIAAEAGFYVVFPLLVTRITTASRKLWAALAIYMICTAFAFVCARGFEIDDTVIYYSLLTQLPIFVVAMALFDMLFSQPKPRIAVVAAVLGLWVLVALVGRHLGLPTRAGLWAEIVAMLLFTAGVLRRYEWRVFAFLGRISFSGYLFHFAVIDILALWLPNARTLAGFLLGLGATSVATIAVAWLSARTIEAWSIALGRALVRLVDSSIRNGAP
jgi:peptidoglycan/LPS O-acetylase OafA/YrhL